MEQYIEKICNEFLDIIKKTEDISAIRVKQTEERGGEFLYNILYPCKTRIESLAARPETEFLVISMLEKYWRIIRPAIVIPAEEILAGDNSRIEQIQCFEKMLQDNPAKEKWVELSKQFKAAAEAGWYPMNLSNMEDLTSVIDIVADALTSLDRLGRLPPYAINRGTPGQDDPIMLTDVAVFRNEYEASKAYMAVKQDRFVAFCGVQPLNRDTKDYFYEWKNGRPDERERNTVCSSVSTEEYLNRCDEHCRSMYTVVRDGENLYFFDVPKREGNWCATTNGFRTSYAPIQIFFKDAPMPTGETASLIVPRERVWSLREILDEEQKVWLPLYFRQVCQMFYDNGAIKTRDVVLPETVAIAVKEDNALIALNLPDDPRTTYVIPEPNELFSEKHKEEIVGCIAGDEECFRSAVELCRFLGIDSTDIRNVPFTDGMMCLADRSRRTFYKRCSEAYYTIIAGRLENIFEDEARRVHEWYHETIRNRWDEIKRNALLGEYAFASTRIHKQPVLNEDGTPKLKKKTSWGPEMIPDVQETTIDEGKEVRRLQPEYREYRVWSNRSLVGKHPPVVVAVVPQNASEIAQICGVTVDELPIFARLANEISVYGRYASRYNRIGKIQFNIRMIFGKRDYSDEIKNLCAVKA